MNSNKRASLPRELHLSQKPDSPPNNRYRPGVVVGNEGLKLPGFGSKDALCEEAREGLETNFRRTLMHMRHGDENKAIIGMRKFSMLMHQLDEKQLWMGLETIREAGSDFERGNELRFNAAQMFGLVEGELWVRLGVLAEVGGDKYADPKTRADAFRMMEWLYPRLNKLLAEKERPRGALAGNAEEDGKVGSGLPAWNTNSVRVAMEEAAKAHAASMGEGAREVERKMASAILTVVFGDGADRRVYEAAFHAFDNIDSPIMSDMLTKDLRGFQLRGGSAKDSSASAWRESGAPKDEHPEFNIGDLDPRMYIGDPRDRD